MTRPSIVPVMPMSEELERLTVDRASSDQMRAVAIEQGMSTLIALPPQGDAFWNNNASTFAGTQDHYANNAYFERPAPVCDRSDTTCVAAANNGLRLTAGSWRSGGMKPASTSRHRAREPPISGRSSSTTTTSNAASTS